MNEPFTMLKPSALFLLFLLCMPTQAQDDGFRLGLKLAPNFAWLQSDDKELEGDGSRVGLSWGIVMDLPIGNTGTYALNTGVLYNSIGGKFKADYETDVTVVKNESELKMNYLEIPLSLKLRTRMEDGPNFYGLIGLTGATKLKARASASTMVTTGGVTTTTTSDDENVTSDIAVFKLGFQAGAGAEVELSSLTAFLGVTYNAGLTNILDKSAKRIVAEDSKTKLLANYLEINVGTYF